MDRQIIDNQIEKDNSLQSYMYDQYVIPEFKRAVAEKKTLVKRVSDALNDIASDAKYSPEFSNEEEKHWVVDMSDKQKEDVAAGVLKLDQNAKGEVFAQFRKNGKYSDKIPIKEEIISHGLTQGDVMLAMQLNAIEKRLEGMIETLDEIQQDVDGIRRGQQNDRIGLYLSGMNLFLESKSIHDPVLKKQILAQAIRGLSDGNAQLIKEALDDIEYLIGDYYKEVKHPRREMDKRIDNINKCFEIIHRSFVVKAVAYYENDEIQAMLAVIDEYCQFLSNAIVPYAGRLGEMDHSDHSLKDGRWEQRAKALSDMKDLQKQLAEDNVYYLNFEREDERVG